MTQCTANFETGTNGNSVATGDAGSGTAWNSVVGAGVGGNTLAYDNTQAYKTLAAKFSNAGTNASEVRLKWTTAQGTVTDHYGRFYLYATAFPGGTLLLMDTTSGDVSFLKITSAGKIQCSDTTGTAFTFTNAIALNQWVRVEYHIVQSTTVGSWEVKLFNNPDSTTATETQSTAANRNNAASSTGVSLGFRSGTAFSYTFWLDNIVAGATSYPGPAIPINTVAPAVTGTATVGSLLTTDNGTWTGDATITYTYQWKRGGSNIASATSSTYTLVSADANQNITCEVTAANGASTGVAATSNSVAVSAATSSAILVVGGKHRVRNAPQASGSRILG